MLFNSQLFIFLFLPVSLLGFYALSFRGHLRASLAWLTAFSLLFYAWWNPSFLLLLIPSTAFNFWLGKELAQPRLLTFLPRRVILIAGIALNLLALGYFKYAGFLVWNLNEIFGLGWDLGKIILPLAISFFTFQQIAYIVDVFNGAKDEPDFLKYLLFVVFFPHLVAGPITHHTQMLPQFSERRIHREEVWLNLSVGFSLFAIGLAKKVILADQLAPFATGIFGVAAQGSQLTFFEAWGGALAYTFQLYFDFSGYSDMAIGLSYLFGVRLPLNFFSPYQAVNMIEFWRRWHISLSHFLRDYLYIPLGGNRRGGFGRYRNLMITMLLGGIWHGAGWTFLIWGGLHGIYLVINHAWRALRARLGHDLRQSSFLGRLLGGTLTFLAAVVAWVFFRADSLKTAFLMLDSMAGRQGFILAENYKLFLNKFFGLGNRIEAFTGIQFTQAEFLSAKLIALVGAAAFIAFLLPNSHQLLHRFSPAITEIRPASPGLWERKLQWRPNLLWAISVFLLFVVSASAFMNSVSEFLYFQF